MENLIEYGYIGLFIGSMLAATIIPFSSDILLMGMLMAGGNMVTTVLVATVGNWLGGMISYAMGYFAKWEWLEKWFKVKEDTLKKQKEKVDKYGAALAFVSWFPLVGDIFAIALGFYKVNTKKVAIYMFIGKGLRFVAWAIIYHFFGTDFTTLIRNIF